MPIILSAIRYWRLGSIFQIWRSQIGPPKPSTHNLSDQNSKMKHIYSERAKNLRTLWQTRAKSVKTKLVKSGYKVMCCENATAWRREVKLRENLRKYSEFLSPWFYSRHFANLNFSSAWCYSGKIIIPCTRLFDQQDRLNCKIYPKSREKS